MIGMDKLHIDIFDQERKIGGAIHTEIPDFRMPKAFLVKMYEKLTSAGVDFHFNTVSDSDLFEQLRQDYDQVVVAIGAQVENTFGFETGNGIVAGLTLLYDLNIYHKENEYSRFYDVIVWGGGNVAMDCARSLKRMNPDVLPVMRKQVPILQSKRILWRWQSDRKWTLQSYIRILQRQMITIPHWRMYGLQKMHGPVQRQSPQPSWMLRHWQRS